MGKLNFRGYLISRFYPTREIRENLCTREIRFTVTQSELRCDVEFQRGDDYFRFQCLDFNSKTIRADICDLSALF